MAKNKQVLGRGLNALIPESEENITASGMNEIEIALIVPNPFQPRRTFVEAEIRELAASIRENGLLQPIVVRKKDDRFELIYGERRFRAFKELGRDRIPALVRDSLSDLDMLSMALVENIQRQNLNEIEEARAYQALIEQCNISHQDVAERVGKSRTAVTNSLRLLRLPEPIQNALIEDRISMGHARALLSVEDTAEMERLCRSIIDRHLSVREIEEALRGSAPESVERKPKSPKAPVESLADPNIEQIREDLQYRLGTQINIQDRQGQGRIEIEFFSYDDLNRIHRALISGKAT